MTSVVVHDGTNIDPMCCVHVPGLTVLGPCISYQSNDWWGDGYGYNQTCCAPRNTQKDSGLFCMGAGYLDLMQNVV